MEILYDSQVSWKPKNFFSFFLNNKIKKNTKKL